MSQRENHGRCLGRKRHYRIRLVTVSAFGALLLGCVESTQYSRDEAVLDSTTGAYLAPNPKDLPVPVLTAVSSSGWRCKAQLLEAHWSYPTRFVQALSPPKAQSFPSCAVTGVPEIASVSGLDEIRLRFDDGKTLPDVIDITWFARVPESEADVLHVTECAIATAECRMAADRSAVVVKPPTEAAKAGVWALWVTPEGVEVGPDDYDAFNTAFWGVSLR